MPTYGSPRRPLRSRPSKRSGAVTARARSTSSSRRSPRMSHASRSTSAGTVPRPRCSWRGYAMSQDDEFLDRIAGELDRLHQALAEAEQWRSADRAPLQPPLHTVLRSLPTPEPAARPLTAHDIAIKTFNRAPRGYRVEEVDQFLGAVAIELARAGGDPAAPSRVTAQEISGKRFTFGPRGYAMHEVDDFLARLVAQLAEHESGWSTTS